MNWYDLHRMRLNFRFENPDKCRAIHSELFMYIVDLWNRLGQKEKFWLPTEMTMHFLWIGSYNTYNKAYKDLVEWWFIKEIKKSVNQHSARVIAISKNDKATDKALDKATIKATVEAPDIIDNNITNKQITNIDDFSIVDYNQDILWLVDKFTNIKEKAYNETQATIKKIGRQKYIDNQYKTVEKLMRAWHTLEQIEDVAIFCTKDDFRKWNVKSLCKLDQANKEWVKYINVLLDKIKW